MQASAVGIDVFLSYNRRDTGPVEVVAAALRDRGLAVFLDRWNIAPGEAFPSRLESALNETRAVVVLIGPGGISGWMRTESDYALVREQRGEDVRVIPVLLPGSDPPLGLIGLKEWIDLRAGAAQPAMLDLLASAVRGGELPAPVSICPYRGLHPFRREDASFFFGRDEFVRRAVQSVSSRSLTAVVGASGSGKSSAIRAGLLPALQKENDTWEFVLTRPGREPFHSLAANLDEILLDPAASADATLRTRAIGDRLAQGDVTLAQLVDDALARRATRPRILLIVDQWEEIYTQCADAAVRHAFVDQLLEASASQAVTVLISVRGDFFDDVLEYRPLADRLHDAVVSIGPMMREELRECAEEPARRVNLSFEPGLCTAILDAVESGPGNLPLLEFVLTELWHQRRGNLLVHSAYEGMGGLNGAIAKRAEQEFAKLSAPQQELLHGVMLQMVRVTPGGVDTRRRATRAEIGEDAWRVATLFADARLLVTGRDETSGEDAIEVAHEALIRHWDRLKRWLDEDREFLLWRQRLHSAMELYVRSAPARVSPRARVLRWAGLRTDDAATLRGGLLAEAKHWAGLRETRLTDHELGFIQTSHRQERTLLRRRVGNAALFALLLVLLGVASTRAIRGYLDERTRRAAEIVNAAVESEDPLVAALLIGELNGQREPFAGATTAARRIANRAVPLAVLNRGESIFTAAAIAADGSKVLAGYEDGAVLLWSSDGSGEASRQPDAPGAVRALELSHDGTLALAVAENGELHVWRTDGSGELNPWGDVAPRVVKAAFGQGGASLVAAGLDGIVQIWPVHDGIQARRFATTSGAPTGLYLDVHGTTIAVTSGNVLEVWQPDATEPRVLRGHTDRILSVSFDSAAALVATSSWDGTARVWNIEERANAGSSVSGIGDRVVVQAADGAIWTASLDAGGKQLVTAAADGTVTVTDLEQPELPARSWRHGASAWAARFSPDGVFVGSAGEDGVAFLAHTADAAPPLTLAGHSAGVSDVQFSGDGSRMITVSRGDGTIRVWHGSGRTDPAVLRLPAPVFSAAWEPRTGTIAIGTDAGAGVWQADRGMLTRLDGHTSGVWSVAFDAVGQRLVTGSWDGTARVWNMADARSVAVLRGHNGKVTARFSPDGGRIATASEDHTARLWSGPDFASSVTLRGHTALVRDIAFSSDGSLVATASDDHTARVWSAGDGASRGVYRHTGPVWSVQFSVDGRQLLTASEDGTAALWNLNDESAVYLRDHDGAVFHASFSPDGERVVTAAADGKARVWTPARGGEHYVFGGDGGQLRAARFSHDGQRIVTASIDGTARIYRTDSPGTPMTLEAHRGAVLDAFFTPDDARVVTVGEDRAVRVWRASWSALHAHLKAATSACLVPEVRERVLRERPATASRNFQKCERTHGRTTHLP